MPDTTPTPEDFARDLMADLAYLNNGWCSPLAQDLAVRGSAAIRLVMYYRAEIRKLQEIVEGFAARCVGQSELLAKRAEGEPCPSE